MADEPENLVLRMGAVFGRWTVTGLPEETHNLRKVPVRCTCGNERAVYYHHLIRGGSRSCGKCDANRLKGLALGRLVGPPANVAKRKATAVNRFWQRVNQKQAEECWEWLGGTGSDGYGDTSWNGRHMKCHRIALALTDGDWNSRLPVCHRCDNPLCCNPTHLWRGTQQDNLADMRSKGRARQGVGRKFPAKLSSNDVAAIRASGLLAKTLAEQFSVSVSYVRHLRMKRSKDRRVP